MQRFGVAHRPCEDEDAPERADKGRRHLPSTRGPVLLAARSGGSVPVPHGHRCANVNLLTSKDDIDVVTGMTRYSGVPVSVHPA